MRTFDRNKLRAHISVPPFSPLIPPISDALTAAEEAIGVPIHVHFYASRKGVWDIDLQKERNIHQLRQLETSKFPIYMKAADIY
jgi:hypothetical protein